MSFFDKVFNRQEPLVSSNQEFWRWFQKNEKQFFHTIKEGEHVEEKFFNPLSEQLNHLKEGYYYLVGIEGDTAELIITVDGDLKNIPFAEDLVNAAPEISGWRFTALKSAMQVADFQINIAGYIFSNDNLYFYSNDHPACPDEIDITVIYDKFNDKDEQTIINGVHIFLDNLLGELNFATVIDSVNITGKNADQPELIPIHKLKAYLNWRQKEFTEKYEALTHDTNDDLYSSLEARLDNDRPLLAIVNATLLNWEGKASHPWILTVEVEFDGEQSDGLPDDETLALLDELDDDLSAKLKSYEGYLDVARQTADGARIFYFACKDFRHPSKVMHHLKQKYSTNFEVNFDIYKDKYWHSFEQYRVR